MRMPKPQSTSREFLARTPRTHIAEVVKFIFGAVLKQDNTSNDRLPGDYVAESTKQQYIPPLPRAFLALPPTKSSGQHFPEPPAPLPDTEPPNLDHLITPHERKRHLQELQILEDARRELDDV